MSTRANSYWLFFDRRKHPSTGLLLLLGVCETILGLSLLANTVVMVQPYYEVMLTILECSAWAWVFLGIGITKIVLALFGKCATHIATLASAMSAFMWWFIVVSAYFSMGQVSVLLVGCGVVAFLASWVYLVGGKWDLPIMNENRFDLA